MLLQRPFVCPANLRYTPTDRCGCASNAWSTSVITHRRRKGGTSEVQEAVVKCDAGQQAVGGGFSINGGADDNTPSAAAVEAINVVGSYPYTSDYKPINERGSFAPDERVVKVVNTGTDDVIVRPG